MNQEKAAELLRYFHDPKNYGKTWSQFMAERSRNHPSHDLYDKHDAPDCILDRNGEVVLALCRRCHRGEADLVQACDAEETP